MYSIAKLPGQFQKDLMRSKFKLDSRKLLELRKVAAQSDNRSLKFWGQKLGRQTMGRGQLEKTLQQLAKNTDIQTLKNIKSQIKSYITEEKEKEKAEQAAATQEKLKARSIAYRKYERIKETRGNIREELERIEAERFKEGGKIVSDIYKEGKENNNQTGKPLTNQPPSVNLPPEMPLD